MSNLSFTSKKINLPVFYLCLRYIEVQMYLAICYPTCFCVEITLQPFSCINSYSFLPLHAYCCCWVPVVLVRVIVRMSPCIFVFGFSGHDLLFAVLWVILVLRASISCRRWWSMCVWFVVFILFIKLHPPTFFWGGRAQMSPSSESLLSWKSSLSCSLSFRWRFRGSERLSFSSDCCSSSERACFPVDAPWNSESLFSPGGMKSSILTESIPLRFFLFRALLLFFFALIGVFIFLRRGPYFWWFSFTHWKFFLVGCTTFCRFRFRWTVSKAAATSVTPLEGGMHFSK